MREEKEIVRIEFTLFSLKIWSLCENTFVYAVIIIRSQLIRVARKKQQEKWRKKRKITSRMHSGSLAF